METIDIEAIQQELQKHGLDRLEPNDPLFMDHLARRLELQWHYEKIQTLLEQQQKQILSANTEFAESLRASYSEWITQGGNHIADTFNSTINQIFSRQLPPNTDDKEKLVIKNKWIIPICIIGTILLTLGIMIGKFLLP